MEIIVALNEREPCMMVMCEGKRKLKPKRGVYRDTRKSGKVGKE